MTTLYKIKNVSKFFIDIFEYISFILPYCLPYKYYYFLWMIRLENDWETLSYRGKFARVKYCVCELTCAYKGKPALEGRHENGSQGKK